MVELNNLYNVSKNAHRVTFLQLLVRMAFSIYYTWAYRTIPSNLVQDVTSILFTVYMALSWAAVLLTFLEYHNESKYIGSSFHKHYWASLEPENKFPWCLLKLYRIPRRIIGLYFMVKFSPVSQNHCDVYSNVYSMCVASQIVTVVNYIWWGALGVVMLIVLLALTHIAWSFCRGREIVREPGKIKIYYTSDYVFTYSYQLSFDPFVWALPVTVHKPDPNNVCALCYNINNDFLTQKTLQCSHKFHADCIDSWSSASKLCPLCATEKNCYV